MSLPLFRQMVGSETENHLLKAFRSGFWSGGMGEYVRKLEKRFAEYTKTEFAFAVNSGTAACRAAMYAVLGNTRLNRNAEHKIAVSTYTCAAGITPIVELQATPAFVDIETETLGMAFDRTVEILLDKSVKALVVTHIYGEPAKHGDEITNLCKAKGILVIQDISECFGIEMKFIPKSDIYVASIRTEKILGAGEGGLISTNDEKLAAYIRQFVDRGKPDTSLKYWYGGYGDNVRMPHMTAAVAYGQTDTLNAVIAGKRRVARMYRDERRLFSKFGSLQSTAKGVAWLNMLLLDPVYGITPADFGSLLAKYGIETRQAFYPTNVIYQNLTGLLLNKEYPVVADVHRRGIVLPSPYNLTDEEMDYIEDCCGRILS